MDQQEEGAPGTLEEALAARPPWTVERKRPGSMREQILDAATVLFYESGIRAVGVEAIVQKAGVTKVTFYRHFSAKDHLVAAYLERRAAYERDSVALARRMTGDDTAQTFRVIALGIGAESCSPGFRGCPFINAAAEFPDPASPARQVVDSHRHWFRSTIETMLTTLGVKDPAAATTDLLMLRDGAMVSGYLGDPGEVGAALYRAGRAVVLAHR